MLHPPRSVVPFAHYHWLMGVTVLLSTGLLHLLTRHLPGVGIAPRAYAIALGLGLLYLFTGTLVWFGVRVGRYLNFACSLIYLTRPRLGLKLWREMNDPEFKAYFAGGNPPARLEG
jgi:hypothetical protein